jgi:hypothetical protein
MVKEEKKISDKSVEKFLNDKTAERKTPSSLIGKKGNPAKAPTFEETMREYKALFSGLR